MLLKIFSNTIVGETFSQSKVFSWGDYTGGSIKTWILLLRVYCVYRMGSVCVWDDVAGSVDLHGRGGGYSIVSGVFSSCTQFWSTQPQQKTKIFTLKASSTKSVYSVTFSHIILALVTWIELENLRTLARGNGNFPCFECFDTRLFTSIKIYHVLAESDQKWKWNLITWKDVVTDPHCPWSFKLKIICSLK